MADKPPPSITTDWLAKVGAVGLRRPWITVIIAIGVLLMSALYAYDLPISTSRYKLVSEDNPSQARLLRFFDRFGYPDSLVMVISGGETQDRRQAVDRLSEAYEKEPDLKGRVLGRLDLDHVAEVLFFLKPDLVTKLREELDGEPADIIEGGIPSWLGAIESKLEGQLEGSEPAPEGGSKKTDEGLRDLARGLRALEAQLSGGDARTELPGFEDDDIPKGVGVDDQGYVVADDGSYLVALFPELPGAEGYQVKPTVDRIRQIRDDAKLPSGVRANLTGLPALVADELGVLQTSLAQTSAATTIGIVLLLLLAFRSKRYAILALLPLGVGVVLTLAAARAMYGGLNLVTSSFIPVLLGLGIDFGVYVLCRYGEEVRAGAPNVRATLLAIAKTGPGMLMGATTTMLAFLMTKNIEFTAYSELGVITAVGLALMLAGTFVLLPPLLHIFGRGQHLRSPELPGVEYLPRAVRAGRFALPIIALVIVLASAPFWPRIQFNARYFDFIPDKTESAWALRQIENDRSLSPVQAGAGADSVEDARKLADRLRKLPTVSAVQTATDVLPELTPDKLAQLRKGFEDTRDPDFDKLRGRKRSAKEIASKVGGIVDAIDEIGFGMRQADRSTKALDEVKTAAKKLQERLKKMPDDAPELAELETRVANIFERAWKTGKSVAERGHYHPTDLPSVFQARFMSKDGKALAVYANPAGDIWNDQVAKHFASDMAEADPEMTGLAMTIYEHLEMIKRGFMRASLMSAGLVIVILLVGFRRLNDALFAVVPVAIGVALLLGVMGSFGIDFDVANVVALPLILGIGIDAGAHLMHRWRESANEHGGVAKIDDMLRGTGAAVMLAGLTTATGFAALMAGDYGGMKTLGLSMSIGIVSCLFASLFVLPALLVALKKAE